MLSSQGPSIIGPNPPVHPLELKLTFLFVEEGRLLRAIWKHPHRQEAQEYSRNTFNDKEETPILNCYMGMLNTKCNKATERSAVS